MNYFHIKRVPNPQWTYRYLLSRKTSGKPLIVNAKEDNVIREGQTVKQSFSLPPVALPEALSSAVKLVMKNYSAKLMKEDASVLCKYLLTRQPPTTFMVKNRKSMQSDAQPQSIEEQNESDQGKSKYSPMRYGQKEAIAYMASRLNPSYAVTYRVLNELALRCPDYKPETLLDFGSGLGTTVWAANELWKNTIYEYQCIDISEDMEKNAKLLRQGGDKNGKPLIKNVYFKQYLPLSNEVCYDVVVSAYSLSELPTIGLRKSTIRTLWEKTKDFLVLIEPGDIHGFLIIDEARNMLLNSDTSDQEADMEGTEDVGHVFAPCPHDAPCPLVQREWPVPCYFAQRAELAYTQKKTFIERKGFFIEKFSYIILRKGERTEKQVFSRLLQPSKKRTRHVLCSLCCPSGEVKTHIFTKRKSGCLYRPTRKSKWGDLIFVPDSEHAVEEEK